MSTKYVELFRIRCRHGYFRDQPCRAFELSPTAQCARLLERYGCLFRKTIGGGSVYYATPGTDGDGPDLLSQFDETLPFTFALTGPSALLGNCTSIKLAEAGATTASVYYFSNLAEHPATFDEEEYLLLHSPAQSEKPEAPLVIDFLPVHPPQFVKTFDKPVAPATAKLFDMLDNEVALKDKAGKPQLPPQEMRALSLDFSGIAEGRYRLKVDGGTDYDFYLSNAASYQRWGLVEIFAGGPKMASVPEPCRVLGSNGAPEKPVAFGIDLAPRKSFWRYYIISQSTANGTYNAPAEHPYDDSQINGTPTKNGESNGVKPVAFSGSVKKKVSDKDAWVFESKEPIALYEYPGKNHEFKLEGNSGINSQAGPFSLPYGRAETTRLEEGSPDGKKEFWSEIYVYL